MKEQLPVEKRFSTGQLLRAFGFAGRGLKFVFQEPNALVHAVATIAAISLGFWLEISRLEWCAVVIVIGLVWIAEAANTAIEHLTDLVSPENHPLAGRAKDSAAAAVLVAAIISVVIGILVFGPKLAARFGG